MSWISVGVAGAGLLVKGVGAYSQAQKAKKGLAALEQQPLPNYQVSPEMQGAYSRAMGMSNQGYTPEEKAAWQQNMARSASQTFRSAVDMGGGNMARTISAGLQANNVAGINQFAAGDAGMKRSNIRYADSLAQALQSQQNMATATSIGRRSQMEQAYGNGLAQANQNFYGSVNDATSLGIEGVQAQAGRKNDLAIAELYAKKPQTPPYYYGE